MEHRPCFYSTMSIYNSQYYFLITFLSTFRVEQKKKFLCKQANYLISLYLRVHKIDIITSNISLLGFFD